MTLEIRRITDDDDDAAAGALVQQAYFQLPDYPRDPEYDRLLGDVAQRALEADVIVGIDDGRIVACLTYVPDRHNVHAEFDDEHAAGFRFFGVDPSVQGTGVGKAMVRWCIAEARRSGREQLKIHTLESMPGAQRLYLHLGFRRDPDNDEDWDGIKGLAFVYDC